MTGIYSSNVPEARSPIYFFNVPLDSLAKSMSHFLDSVGHTFVGLWPFHLSFG